MRLSSALTPPQNHAPSSHTSPNRSTPSDLRHKPTTCGISDSGSAPHANLYPTATLECDSSGLRTAGRRLRRLHDETIEAKWTYALPSSSGPGHCPLPAKTGVRV